MLTFIQLRDIRPKLLTYYSDPWNPQSSAELRDLGRELRVIQVPWASWILGFALGHGVMFPGCGPFPRVSCKGSSGQGLPAAGSVSITIVSLKESPSIWNP
jgi:hypothetical protein